jgi:hypothetical protein
LGFGTIKCIQTLDKTLHRGRHPKEYCDFVLNEISDVDSAAKLAEKLNEIRKLLLKVKSIGDK